MNEQDFVIENRTDVPASLMAEMAELYVDVYAEPPYNSGPLWDRDAFVARTLRQSQRDGFRLLVARSRVEELIGFTFGFTFAPHAWWAGSSNEPPARVKSEAKFALIELVVRRGWRGRGIGKSLHDAILITRQERYAILTALASAPARDMYRRWGWAQVGAEQHTPDSPTLDSLVFDLRQFASTLPPG